MGRSRVLSGFIALAAYVLFTGSAIGTTYTEGTNGDLGNVGTSPTNVTLTNGSNLITGSTVSGDRDYLHVTLPGGSSLSQILLNSYSAADLSFMGVQSGTQVTVDPTAGTATGLIGWTHFGPALVGTNILDDVGAGNTNGATGFTPPLTGSDYSFWIQQTGATLTNYQFDFVVVPEPSAVAMLVLAGGWLLPRRTRNKS